MRCDKSSRRGGQLHQRAACQRGRAEHDERDAGGEAEHGGNADDDLMPPHDLDGPSQVQRLLAHPVSACRSVSPLSGGSDTDHDTADLVKEWFTLVPPSMNSRRVLIGSPGTERPRPSRVVAGTRRPKLPEYQPRMGSVWPRCRLHASPPGSASHAAPG